jgi:hypothetical protein
MLTDTTTRPHPRFHAISQCGSLPAECAMTGGTFLGFVAQNRQEQLHIWVCNDVFWCRLSREQRQRFLLFLRARQAFKRSTELLPPSHEAADCFERSNRKVNCAVASRRFFLEVADGEWKSDKVYEHVLKTLR